MNTPQSSNDSKERYKPQIVEGASENSIELQPTSADNSSSLISTITIPDDVWVHVLSYLPFSDSLTCRTVSKDFKQFANDALEQNGIQTLLMGTLPPYTSKVRFTPHKTEVVKFTHSFSRDWNESFRTKEGMFDNVKDFFNTLEVSVDPPALLQNSNKSLASYLCNDVSKISMCEKIRFGARYYSFQMCQDAIPSCRKAMSWVHFLFKHHKVAKETVLGVLLSADAERIEMVTIACRHSYDEARRSTMEDRQERIIFFSTATGIPIQVHSRIEEKGYWDWDAQEHGGQDPAAGG